MSNVWHLCVLHTVKNVSKHLACNLPYSCAWEKLLIYPFWKGEIKTLFMFIITCITFLAALSACMNLFLLIWLHVLLAQWGNQTTMVFSYNTRWVNIMVCFVHWLPLHSVLITTLMTRVVPLEWATGLASQKRPARLDASLITVVMESNHTIINDCNHICLPL